MLYYSNVNYKYQVKPICNNNIIMLNKFDNYLIGSIILETASTLMIKNTNQNKIWFIPVYLGYGISFYFFPKSLEYYDISVAYTAWCGIGIIFTNLFDLIILKKILTFRKIISILFVVSGIYLSK